MKNSFTKLPLKGAPCMGAALLITGLAAIGAALAAESYPSRPIRLVHGYASGSSMDTNARAIADKLTPLLGQQVVVDSRPGATGMIANKIVASSPPDGYTLLAAPSSALTSTPHLQKSFDPKRDIVPISLIGEFAFFLAAHPNVPARNAKELISLAKRQPGKLAFASTGIGSAYHLAGELFAVMGGIKMLHVPYRGGGAAAITDLMTGRVDLVWNSPVFLLPHVQSGKLRGLGVTGPRRIAAAPAVPTIKESGLPGYELMGWQGIVAPAGTPKEIVTRINALVTRILSDSGIKQHWTSVGLEQPSAGTPEQFAAVLRADYDRYGELINRIGLKGN